MDSSDRLIGQQLGQYQITALLGKHIAFFSVCNGKGQVIILNGENSNEIPLPLTEGVYSLAVSPDGRQIAISTARGIFAMASDGVGLHQLMSTSGVVLSITWSFDSRHIAYMMLVNKSRMIYVADINGANNHRLLNDAAAAWQPTWIH